ncbi:acetylornithine aminotransferase [Phlyctochytrium planicorne]|nr:acetylornithine aminotransferase [Phlyctochytrium planicorne]
MHNRITQRCGASLLTSARTTSFISQSRHSLQQQHSRSYAIPPRHPTHPDSHPSPSPHTLQLRSTLNSLLPLYPQALPIITHGSGCSLFDSDNRRYLDLGAGIAVNALGHADKEVMEAVRDQVGKIVHVCNLYRNEYAGELAGRLLQGIRGESGDAVWGEGSKVFLCNSGTEANEASIKFARKYAKYIRPNSSNAPFGILSFNNAFHGRTMGALSATPNVKYQAPFTPLIPGFTSLPFNDIPALETVDFSTLAAVIVEPVQGEGGIFVGNHEWFKILKEKCDAAGTLLIFDEVQCGLGRLGTFTGHAHLGFEPDLISIAKPLANGIPIGAVLLTPKVADSIKPGDHGTTFGGNPFSARVGSVVIKRIQSPGFLDHVKDTGAYFMKRLKELSDGSPILAEVRGMGLMIGVQLRETVETSLFVDLCRERGVMVLSAGCNTVRIVPPLIITKEEVDEAMEVFEDVVEIMEGYIARGKDLKK